MQSCMVHHRPVSVLASALASSVHTSPGTGLDIESSYLVHICTYVSHMYISNILWFWHVIFKWQLFCYFSLICYPVNIDSHRDFMSHLLKYLFFTYIHKRNNVTAAFFLKFMRIFLKSIDFTSLSHSNLMCFGIQATKSKLCVLS